MSGVHLQWGKSLHNIWTKRTSLLVERTVINVLLYETIKGEVFNIWRPWRRNGRIKWNQFTLQRLLLFLPLPSLPGRYGGVHTQTLISCPPSSCVLSHVFKTCAVILITKCAGRQARQSTRCFLRSSIVQDGSSEIKKTLRTRTLI